MRESSEPGVAWDATWRETLVGNLEILARQLWQIEISDVFADGCFVEEKAHPNDIDGYFVCTLEDLASGYLTRKLNARSLQSVDLGSPLPAGQSL